MKRLRSFFLFVVFSSVLAVRFAYAGNDFVVDRTLPEYAIKKNFNVSFPFDKINNSVDLILDLISENPSDLELKLELAKNYNLLKLYGKSLELLKALLKSNSESPDIYEVLGDTYAAAGEKEKELFCYGRMVYYDYLNMRRHIILANSFLKYGMTASAKEEFRKALKINPFYEAAYYGLGLIAYENGDMDAALNYFLKAVKCRKEKRALNNAGAIFGKKGNYYKAGRFLGDALEIDRFYGIANYNFGLLMLRKLKYEDAEKYYSAVLNDKAAGELYCRAHYALGIIYEQKGEYDKAINEFNEIVKHCDDMNCKVIIAKLYGKSRKLKNAISVYENIIANRACVRPSIMLDYAELLIKNGNKKESEEICLDVLKKNVKYGRAHFILFKIYLLRGDFSSALKEFLLSGAYIFSSVRVFFYSVFFLFVFIFAFRIFFRRG